MRFRPVKRVIDVPPLWPLMTREWWGLGPSDGEVLWKALQYSSYSRPIALRHQLALPGTMQVDLQHFVLTLLTPQTAMAIVEDLVHEGRLARACASRIQDTILRHVDAHGRWL